MLVDGRPAGKSDRVPAGEWLDVTLPAVAAPQPVPEPVPGLVVCYEDADVIVIDKPAGVAAHPTPGWTGPTVLQGLLAGGHQIATSGAAERKGIHPDPLRGTIDAPIARHPSGDGRFAVIADGRPAITHYDTVEAFRAASLIEVKLETGRTHQIRVHMAAVRHPCVGDRLYGADPVLAARLGIGRQWLHAKALGFAHPGDGRLVEFTSDYPADLRASLEMLAAES